MWSLRKWVRSHPGVARISRSAARLVPDISVTRDVPHVGPLSFGLRRHRWLLSPDCFEGHRLILAMFQRLIRADDVVYDVGANIGYYARFALAHFPVGRWIAFEPMSANVRLLQKNLSRHAGRTAIFPVAVGDHDGEEVLQIDDFSSGAAVLDRISGGRASPGREDLGLPPKTERVAMRRLDAIVLEKGLPGPNVIKIDTEGAEVEVLTGARETLERHKPRLLIATHGADRAAAVLRILQPLGYHCFGFMEGDNQPRYGLLELARVGALTDNNILCSTDPDELAAPIVPLPLQRLDRGATDGVPK